MCAAWLTGVAIEGPFVLPPLAQLPAEDPGFRRGVRPLPRIHQADGAVLGVSYPTIKNRLNSIGSQLSFVEIEQGSESELSAPTRGEVLERLSRGEITVTQALDQLKQK